MKNWFDWIIAWCKSRNITTHTIGAGIVGFAVIYDSSPEARNYVGQFFTGYPVVVTRLGEICANICAGVALWRNYSHALSPAGIVATAKSIQAQPDAPTAAQVSAATTSKP